MSYEVRTPLNGIIGFTKLLNDDAVPAGVRKQYLDMIARRGRNLLQIVNDIINISLLDTGQVEIKRIPFNLNQLLYDIYAVFNSNEYDNKTENVSFKLNLGLSDSQSNIITDPIRIEQILSNLIDNAFRFTRQGHVEYGYEIVAGQSIKFYVKDTGIGIPDELREKIFTRFAKNQSEYTSKRNRTGLGLPITKGLVELLKGKLWYESKVDDGTTFFFSIPYSPANSDTKSYVSRSSVSSQSLNFKGKTILIVEDDLISYQFIEALLRNTEAKLIHAKNGEDAIDIVTMVNSIDLVVMDMRLPFIDGYEATARIKKKNPNLIVIAQTANVMSDDKSKCFAVGCDDYLPKPIDPDDFLRVVAHHLSKPKIST
jgi:CheY-like chemotaxis protein